MKKLICEMCGSAELIKENGLFVCQHCGTKYSVEEARKMMVEGTVEVTGTVKVDSSDKLANLYQVARRAKDDNNGENAAKYYDMILVEDPTSWEASFYVVYFKAMECKIAQIQSAAISVNNCLDSVLKLIRNHVEGEEEQVKAAKDVATHTMLIAMMLYNGAKSHYDGIDLQIKANYIQEWCNNASSCADIMYNLGNQLENIFQDNLDLCKEAAEAWKVGINLHNGYLGYLQDKAGNQNVMKTYAEKIVKYDASYTLPSFKTDNPDGCYIATCVYGSYDCPQVWTLRRFRDYTLDETWYGRVFIKCYYAISPTLVQWFGETKWFKKFWKSKLDKMVANLKSKGVEDTYYMDKY